jgi:hypothetical protein
VQIVSTTSGEMIVQGLVPSSPAVTGRPHIFAFATSSSSFASQCGRTLKISVPGKNATFAAYGTDNGKGRPGSGSKKSEDGTKSGFVIGDPISFEGQSPHSNQVLESEKVSETTSRKECKSFSPRGGPPRIGKEGEDPYRILDDGHKVYLDELDVITLLEPPPFLRPLQSVYYNHAAYLW